MVEKGCFEPTVASSQYKKEFCSSIEMKFQSLLVVLLVCIIIGTLTSVDAQKNRNKPMRGRGWRNPKQGPKKPGDTFVDKCLAHIRIHFLRLMREQKLKDAKLKGATKLSSVFRKHLMFLGGDEKSQFFHIIFKTLRICVIECYNVLNPSEDELIDFIKNSIADLRKVCETAAKGVIEIPTDGTQCPFPDDLECDPTSEYRTIDGRCNNLKRPQWGSASIPLIRNLPPVYEGPMMNEPRSHGINGQKLPTSREVAVAIHEDKEEAVSHLTDLVMTFGQLVDHDTDRVPNTKIKVDGKAVTPDCGLNGCGINLDPDSFDPNSPCFPIPILPDDPFFVNKDCLEFIRSEQVTNLECSSLVPEQLNVISSYLDAAFIYGDNPSITAKVRDLSDDKRGKLLTRPHPFQCGKKPLLPPDDHPDCKVKDDPILTCTIAGDARVNEHVGLMCKHTIYLRLHNMIEEELYRLNSPVWDGEKLYQETRKIVGAIWQHTIYNEYLPVLLGPQLMKKYDLELLPDGYYMEYDDMVDASTSNQFATSSFRYGHSNIATTQLLVDDNGNHEAIHLSELFFNPTRYYKEVDGFGGCCDQFTRGMTSAPMRATDRFFSPQVGQHMFTDFPAHGVGTSLSSLNIQRGRDHGLPGYTEWRKYCGLSVPKTFDDLCDDIPSKSVRKRFSELYSHVEDIDSFPAGVAERTVPGGIVGPLFGCLIGEQFEKYRRGDRFWYESGHEKSPKFTLDQLNEIRKMTISKILCMTADKIKEIQPYALIAPDLDDINHSLVDNALHSSELSDRGLLMERFGANKKVRCSCMPGMDLTKWKVQS